MGVFMIDRELLEKQALEAVCACLYYDLADNIDAEADDSLIAIVEHRITCDNCGQ